MADQNQEREVILLTIDIATLVYLTGFAFIFALAFGLQLKYWKDALEKLENRAQQVQTILTERLKQQNNFLNQIRKELHENPCQLLFVAQINLNIVEEQRLGDDHIIYFANTSRLVSQTIQELRKLMKRLEEATTPAESLTAGIRHELDKIRHASHTDTSVTVTGRAFPLRPEQEIILLKMIEELWNTMPAYALPDELQTELCFDATGFELLMVIAHYQPIDAALLHNYSQQAEMMQEKCRLIDFDCRQLVENNRTVVFRLYTRKQNARGRRKSYCW